MKFLLTVLLVISSALLFAQNEKPNKPSMEQTKAKILEGIEKRASILNTFKSCVTAASDREAIKKCRDAHRDANQALRKDQKQRRQQRKGNKPADM